TRFASGSSSAAALSSASVDGSTVPGVGGVSACATIIIVGAEKLSHTPRKSAIGRTACPAPGDLIAERRESVSCRQCVMVCGARLSMDCARVKELQGGDIAPLVVRRPDNPTLAQNRQEKDCRYQKALTV